MSILILVFWFNLWNLSIFQIHFTKNNPLCTDPQLIWQCKCFFVTVTMAVNSPEPTLFAVVYIFLWFSNIFNGDVASFDFVIFFVFIVIALIFVKSCHSGTYRCVVIPLGTLVWLGGGRSRQGWGFLDGVSWCRCGGRWRGGTGYLVWLGINRHQLRFIHHPPTIGTVRSKLKWKRTASLCSWKRNKRSLEPPWYYPNNISDDTTLILFYCKWSQRLMIWYFHLVFKQSLFIV